MKKMLTAFIGLLLVGLSFGAFAVPPDVSSLTTAVDFSTVITAILAVAGTLVGVYITIKAVKFVMAQVKGG